MDIVERFLKYVSFDTCSDSSSETVPSTAHQKDLGAYLAKELQELGLENAHMDEYGYVYAWIPESKGLKAEGKDLPAIGFIAHMDVVSDVPSANIKTHFEERDGQQVIATDGTTLLGADDKAGIAEIVTAAEYFMNHPEVKHGRICIAFTPDEEIGRGPDHFDVKGFGADFAYTLDGGTLGEIEYENFNAASAKVLIHGYNVHPGGAKNKMINAVLIASEFIEALPKDEIPAKTEGYEGFYHVTSVEGDVSEASVRMILRDHDIDKLNIKKDTVKAIAEKLGEKYGKDRIECFVKDGYRNMREKIESCMFIVDKAKQAMKDAGVEPEICAIRGGTDGATLSFMGLPCPNLSTGGANFHGVREYVVVPAMHKMVEIVINIAKV